MPNTKTKQKEQSKTPKGQDYISAVLFGESEDGKTEYPEYHTKDRMLALFAFDDTDTPKEVAKKFRLWAKYFFPKIFKKPDCEKHREADHKVARLYLGLDDDLVYLGFRGLSKTTRTGLFSCFAILNDMRENKRKFCKFLTADQKSGTRFVTSCYNRLINPRVVSLYGMIFADKKQNEKKRSTTMTSWETITGITMTTKTIGVSQRGDVAGDEESNRPDWQICDDFETSKTLLSAVTTHNLWLNIREAQNGRADGGACLYHGQYLSEAGNVHKLVKMFDNVLIVPIEDENGNPTWEERFNKQDIDILRREDDFAGEYLCKPSVSSDVFFDRERVESMPVRKPIDTIAGFKIFREYDPAHRYALGADVAGGVGLDYSATAIIDFDVFPCEVVATFLSNKTRPNSFGHEIVREGKMFGQCLVAPENNKFDEVIGVLKQEYPIDMIFQTQRDDKKADPRIGRSSIEFGWNTNSSTRPKMLNELADAVKKGELILNDPVLIEQAKEYTRGHLLDREVDPRLVSQFHDLLIACAITWQMINHVQSKEETYVPESNYTPMSEYETPFVPERKRSKNQIPGAIPGVKYE